MEDIEGDGGWDGNDEGGEGGGRSGDEDDEGGARNWDEGDEGGGRDEGEAAGIAVTPLTQPGGRGGVGLVPVPPRINRQTSAGRGEGGREELPLSFVVAFLRYVAGI